MITPTPSQVAIRDHKDRDLLVLAPAGCGKTEALALRVQGFLQRGDVALPEKILVVTFSNRARDNIRERMLIYLGASQLRERVSVVNFHGLSARIFKAHANTIGLDPDLKISESDWVGEECRHKGLEFSVEARAKDALQRAKLECRTDDEVDAFLSSSGETDALEIERDRVADNRLTYDDLPRVAELILRNRKVAELYQAHFGAIVVDEFQDLTLQQLRIISAIGHKKTTYAGDLAQGIYGFTGAKPDEVFKRISSECAGVVTFSESHRSSPAVLAAVNSLIPVTGGTALTAANPASWPGGGLFATARFDTDEDEARWTADMARMLLAKVPHHRIGIMARTVNRRAAVEAALTDLGIEFFRWDDGVLDTETARAMRSMLGSLDLSAFESANDGFEFLRILSGVDSLIEVTAKENLVDALGWCFELLRDGMTPQEIRERIRVGDETKLVTMPGIHLLTGHVGKGQQFDWAMVIGAEDGAIPDFRAKSNDAVAEEARVLSVMISRARHGVFVSHAVDVAAASGKRWNRDQSPFFKQLTIANPTGGQGVWGWLKAVDWEAISAR